MGVASDLASQTITNFDADAVDISSVSSALESSVDELGDAVSDINLKEAGVNGALGALGGGTAKLAQTMKFSDTATGVITETTNAATSAKKEELAK
ncbi:hypothetical protein [Alteromonas hispanica]|uniref:Uncharacterized protein n=1 Tax=Alteromonas hispanica TaxID=315421 RepID=A0A6L9MY57_9ALTE|nr:hypothetical protein [Alteromonas hispanica]NDW23096.1 hypothetical protein [Alteromonas hispanica]